PIWTNETGRLARSSKRASTVRGGTTASGEPAVGQLQPGWFSEPSEIWRAEKNSEIDSGTGTGGVHTFWPDTPKHVYMRTGSSEPDVADAKPASSSLCRSDLRRRRLYRGDGHRSDGRCKRNDFRGRRSAGGRAA